MGKTDPTETKLINIWGGWAKRGGRGGRATHAWVLHFSCPLRDLARFLTERTQAAERGLNSYPRSTLCTDGNIRSRQKFPTSLLPSHKHRAQLLVSGVGEVRVLACLGDPHYRVAGVLLTPASIVDVFKRNAGITFCTLRNGKHRNKEKFPCLSPKLQGEFLCFLVECSCVHFDRNCFHWRRTDTHTVTINAYFIYIYIYICIYIYIYSGNIYGEKKKNWLQFFLLDIDLL